MEYSQREEIRKRMEAAIVEIQKRILELEENTKPVSPENAIGRVSRMDAINNKGVAESALRSARSKLSKLRMALGNIGREDFGICSDCKQPIQIGRLMFLPESSKCVRCAER